MDWKDLILFPLYYLLASLFIYVLSKRITSVEYKKYFVLGIHLKIFGAIALGLIYYFYYGGGDTINFYNDSSFLYNLFWEDSNLAIKSIFYDLKELFPNRNIFKTYKFWDTSSFLVIRIAFIFSLICFNSYAVIAMCFAILSFIGIWLLFKVFREESYQIDSKLALSFLFLPSLVFWGSGIMKDSLTIFGLGLFVYSFYKLFFKKRIGFKYILILVLSFFILKTLKVYVFYSILPGMLLWLYIHYRKQISSKALRLLITPFLLLIILSMGYLAATELQAQGRYSLDNLSSSSIMISDYLYHKGVAESGSAFRLSTTFDGSFTSLIRVMPEALMTVFFRPFLFEVKNPVMLISAIENTFILYLFIKSIWLMISQKVKRKVIHNNGLLYLSIIFSVILGVGITISTANLGSLSRYRIPFLPFLITVLFIIIEQRKVHKP